MTRRLLLLALIVSFALPVACKKPRKQVLSRDQNDQVQKAISTTAPTPQHAVGVDFDGKVRLVGYDLSAKAVKAGEAFEVTWYWESLTDLQGDWKVFVHFESPGKKRTVHDHHPVAELYPMKKWKK